VTSAAVRAVVAAADDLGAAFAARDVDAALACFAPDDAIGYVGSEHGEAATGRRAVAELFTAVFARDEAYSWRATEPVVHGLGDHAYLIADAEGLARADDGTSTGFRYRISGLLHLIDGRWRWRHCHGCEPAAGG
jgi:ketosteroid isomerase-like protein